MKSPGPSPMPFATEDLAQVGQWSLNWLRAQADRLERALDRTDGRISDNLANHRPTDWLGAYCDIRAAAEIVFMAASVVLANAWSIEEAKSSSPPPPTTATGRAGPEGGVIADTSILPSQGPVYPRSHPQIRCGAVGASHRAAAFQALEDLTSPLP